MWKIIIHQLTNRVLLFIMLKSLSLELITHFFPGISTYYFPFTLPLLPIASSLQLTFTPEIFFLGVITFFPRILQLPFTLALASSLLKNLSRGQYETTLVM